MPRAGAALVSPRALLLAVAVEQAQLSKWLGCEATQQGQELAAAFASFLWGVRKPTVPGLQGGQVKEGL